MTTIRTPAKIIPRAFPGIKPDNLKHKIDYYGLVTLVLAALVARVQEALLPPGTE